MKELLNKLPKSWDEITLHQFQTITSTPITEDDDMFNGVQNTIEVVSKLTGTPVDVLEDLPLKELQEIGKRLDFMVTPPKPSKKTILNKWKSLDDISYNDFISYHQLNDKQLENLHVFVKNFSKTNLTQEEILNLPITDVLQGFFLFRKQLRVYLATLTLSTKREIKHLQRQELKQKMI